jgi:hypothetical protein
MPVNSAPKWDLPTLCTHEAGHCVVLMHTRSRPVLSVSVFPQSKRVGYTRKIGGRCSHGEFGFLADPREQALADMVFAWGGRAAEKKLFGGEPPWPVFSDGYDSDGQHAWRLAQQLTRTHAEATKLYWQKYAEAYAIVSRSDRWRIVTAIATELQTRHRLEGKEVWETAYRALGVKPAGRR